MLKTTLLLALLPATLAPYLDTAAVDLFPREQSPTQTRPRSLPHSYGARADSLNGIAGHTFGEPRSQFPELMTKGYQDSDGYTYYSAKEGQELGWFGKNAGHVRSVYRFYQDKFASFDATAQGTDQPLLAEKTLYLFGKGQPESPKNLAYGEAATNWEGQRVRVKFVAGHNECRLIVISKLAIAQKAAVEAAQKKAEAAARAAKLRADNAPTTH
jgi:hypothetical protein